MNQSDIRNANRIIFLLAYPDDSGACEALSFNSNAHVEAMVRARYPNVRVNRKTEYGQTSWRYAL